MCFELLTSGSREMLPKKHDEEVEIIAFCESFFLYDIFVDGDR